jgi:hypothetical protein
MRLAIILTLAAFPFLGAVLLGWLGPKRTWATHYRRARERTAALADDADRQAERLEAADARLEASQQRLVGRVVRRRKSVAL